MNVNPSRFFDETPKKVPASPARRTGETLGFTPVQLCDKSPSRRPVPHHKSTIFTDANDNNVKRPPSSPARNVDTQSRVFGGKADRTPQRLCATATWTSNVFTDKPGDVTPHTTPKRSIPTQNRNPITGMCKSATVGAETLCLANGHTNGHTNGHSNGHTNGYTNGDTNGVH